MKTHYLLLGAALVSLAAADASAEMSAVLTDPLGWLYPDSKVSEQTPFAGTDVPANGLVEANVLVNGLKPGRPAKVSASAAGGAWYRLVDVPVERNTSIEDWCERPKEKKNPYVTRRAPFRVYDAMEPISGTVVPEGPVAAFAWQLDATNLTAAGEQKVVLSVEQDGVRRELPFRITVHPVTLPPPNRSQFRYVNWMRLGGIATDSKVGLWTDEHYGRIAEYVRLAVRGRQNIAWLPLWTFLSRRGDGSLEVNEERFSRLVRTYVDNGIRWIAGGHLCNAGWGSTNVTVALTGRNAWAPEGEADLREICGEIMKLVRKHHLESRWLQHLADEPTTPESALRYQAASATVHAQMPRIVLLDAVCTTNIGAALDIYVPNIRLWQENRAHYDAWAAAGKEIWGYVCLTPGGKWMNRLMDGELIRPTLIPWMSSRAGICGFLHWGFNFPAKGQDLLKTSCWQERPGGNAAPAGDNHLVYPRPEGPWPSVRLWATRQGVEDYELLAKVRARNPSRANGIIDQMVTAFDDYRTDLVLYRRLRGEILRAAGAADISVRCLRDSHQYGVAESAEFEVSAPQAGTPVEISFKRGYLPIGETVVTTTPARVTFRLGEPGFVLCEARERTAGGAAGKPAVAGAGFDPHAIRPALPPPADYEAFWERAFAEQAAVEPDFKVRPLGNGAELVSCRTVQGTRMYGLLHVPAGKGACPLQVNVGGGDSVRSVAEAVAAAGSKDYAERGFLFIHLPPYEPAATQAEAGERHRRWKREVGTSALFNWNCEKGPKDRWFYRCILGSCRLIEYAAKRAGVDPARVYYTGGSTGGGYGVFLAAFSPYIRAAVCEVPNYGNAGGPSVGRPSGEDDRGAHWQTSLYYDAAYCAPRITCPVFMSCGYVDFYCVPETVYCIYNALRCRKVLYEKTLNGHGDRPKGYAEVRDAWLRSSFGM